MPYTEANYENDVVSLFQNDLDYTHLYGPDVERDYHSPLYNIKYLAKWFPQC